MTSPARRVLGTLPGVLALAVYVVLVAGPTPPDDVDADLGTPAEHQLVVTHDPAR